MVVSETQVERCVVGVRLQLHRALEGLDGGAGLSGFAKPRSGVEQILVGRWRDERLEQRIGFLAATVIEIRDDQLSRDRRIPRREPYGRCEFLNRFGGDSVLPEQAA